MRIKYLFIVLFLGGFFVQGQLSEEDYSPLVSQGKMPDAFVIPTEEKIEMDVQIDRNSMTPNQERDFLERIHYNIDGLLQSGIVLFGDPATKYVQSVAKNLLKDEPKLRRQLQFYVIKSNVTNALSTDQGIIFVTLGLLAQIENEAQLAYVLSHEIAHFQEEHVEESYTNRISIDQRSGYDQRITSLSNHSKENEIEADKKGIKLYHEAGYAKSELLSAFDVLMYSYLPFDEVVLPKDYFNNEFLFVPEIYFPEEINPILAEEDYDDDKSSHPNIRKRKDAVLEEVESYSDWGNKEYSISKEEFEKIRDIARFESVRIDILNGSYADALYAIFLLERTYSNNLFLNQAKAKAWLGLVNSKKSGSYSNAVSRPSKVEGESHAIHFFLRKVSKIQLMTLAMRQIEDIRKKYPDDFEIKEINGKMIDFLADYEKFKLKDFRRITYDLALERFERSKAALNDSTSIEDSELEKDDESLSKYDKIKKKRNAETATSVDEEFDEEKFHIYAISDLLGDDNFKKAYKERKEEIEIEQTEENRLNSLSTKEYRKEIRERNKLENGSVILVEPAFFTYFYDEDLPKESAETATLIKESLLKYAERFSIQVYNSTIDVEKQTTKEYNARVVLMEYMWQRGQNEKGYIFPVNYLDLMKTLKSSGSSQILFVLGSQRSTKATHRTSLTFLLIDVEKGEIVELDNASMRKPKRHLVDGYVYDVLARITSSK